MSYLLLFVLILALAGVVAVLIVIVRGGAVDEAKAKAAIDAAEAKTGATLAGWWARLRAKLAKKKEGA